MTPIGRHLANTLLVLLLGTGVSVRAQEARAGAPEVEFAARARVPRPLLGSGSEDATAASTHVTMAARPAAHESVGDVLADVPGARAYRAGTLGSFTSASLRGAEIEHTAVLFGDLPVSGADAAAFDLSTIPASLLDGVIVYRGGAPVWLGLGAIGGVIQLVPRRAHARELGASGIIGSYSLWGTEGHAALANERSADAPSLFAAAGVTGSEGDFPYLYDNGTVLNDTDDHIVRRANADALDGHGLGYLRIPALGGHFDVVALGFERVAGEPASAADPAFRARRNLVRGIAAASWTRESWEGELRLWRAQILAGGSYQRARFTDLYGEVGSAGADRTDDRSARGFGRLAGSAGVTPWLEATAVASLEHDVFVPDDPFALVPLPDSVRDSLAGAAELNLHGALVGHAVELRPSVRYEHTDARLHAKQFVNLVTTEVSGGAPTYRIAGALELVPGIALSASGATGERVPSLLELFGDGALLNGNTGLASEHATMLDAGVAATGWLDRTGGTVELRVFRTWMDDLIVWVPNALREQTPRNLNDAAILGLEAGVRGRVGRHLGLTAAATLLDTEGKAGKELPGRARYAALARPDVDTGPLGAVRAWQSFVELRVIGPSYDEPDNVVPATRPQAFFDAGTGILLLAGRIELRLTARDLFDRGGFDVRGFQLPGRTFVASLHCKENV